MAAVDAEQQAEAAPLVLPGIHDEVVAQVQNAGYDTAQSILDGGIEGLIEHGLDAETAQAVLDAAEAVRAEEQAAQAAADAQAAETPAGEAGQAPASETQETEPAGDGAEPPAEPQG